MQIIQCQHCGKDFIPNKPWQKYCGQFCNKAAYYARRKPPSMLDDPITGPTLAQEAENERRKNLQPEYQDTHSSEIVRKARELLDSQEPPNTLERLYGDRASKGDDK